MATTIPVQPHLPVEDYTYYYTHPSSVFPRLAHLTLSLAQDHMDLGMMFAQEHRAKNTGFAHSSEQTITARNRAAEYEALEITASIMELRGRIKAQELEYEFLQLLITQSDLTPYAGPGKVALNG